MTRKEKRLARIVALKAIYAFEVSQIDISRALEVIFGAIDSDYRELDELIGFYKSNKKISDSWKDVNPKSRTERINFLKEESPEFGEKYVKWHHWSIVDDLEKMPSASVIAYSEKLARLAISHEKYCNELIKERLQNWEMDRVSLIDRLILKLEIAEMLFEETVPPKVSIVEGVEIAKLFSTSDSGRFINGILDSVYNDSLKGLINFEK